MFFQIMRHHFYLLLFFPQIVANGEIDLHFFQNDYTCTLERANVEYYNKDLVKKASATSFKYNRTNIALNLTAEYKIDVGSKLHAVFQLYKFASNEYRLFPLRYGDKACKFFDSNFAGIQEFLKCGNFTGCFFKKNTVYHMCNFIPDCSKLPPHMPTGRFMLETDFIYESISFYIFKVYAAIHRPEVKNFRTV